MDRGDEFVATLVINMSMLCCVLFFCSLAFTLNPDRIRVNTELMC